MTNARTALLALATMLVAATIAVPFDSERIEALRFLRAYGFLKDDGKSLSSDNATSLRRALSLFQEYYQLSGNGALEAVTLHLRRKPRCGLADIPDRAYSPIARKWPKTRLAWNFQVASEEISRTAETGAHTYANRRNVSICPAVFDGPGGALAHAFFPSGTTDFTSEIHVDDSEPWYVYLNKNPPDTHHLLQTLTHEIGHALGLQHSMRNDSIMFPYIPDIENQFPVKLSIEDILAIQNLYGSHDDGNYPTATPATTAAPATTSVAPTDPARADLCALRRVDAALIMNHRLYIANRRNVWSVDMTEKCYGRPMTLTDYATFLPANFTQIVLGDCHGKEISLTPDTWKELLDLRLALLSHFRSDERDEARPTPIHIGQLTLRFGKLNNLRIFRLETPKIRLAVSKSTVVNILNLELCVNRIVASLSG
ncbi:stromelysin-1-like [Polyergus mexicanus]|uniref:stromelysin-1-like n=1 Tax=Polyergus mexicanus TaxID=615972 RepID=UPI0038B6711A